MVSRTAVLVTCGVLTAAAAAAQTAAPNPTQRPTAVATTTDTGTPLFRVTVVGRETNAINFRPRSGETKIDFERVTRGAKGDGMPRHRRKGLHLDRRELRHAARAVELRL